ncbi:hypothetical protein [Streptosporangium carneum]|uniref:Uncharacterized protein n=1 Tax=Streptosporangium carneum TaxID=47481 RepID=A0A9W6I0C9_9ACTN|nr:hypothetical protein [Streptosporangium carneum]GLK08873.1 hypothetical protein GCM10017600_22780 [Streptosporangium carneum]
MPRTGPRSPSPAGLVCVMIGSSQAVATVANYVEGSILRILFVILVGVVSGAVAYLTISNAPRSQKKFLRSAM